MKIGSKPSASAARRVWPARQAEHTFAQCHETNLKHPEIKTQKKCRGLLPHFSRCLDDPVELAPHLFFAHHFGINAAEAALRAQR